MFRSLGDERRTVQIPAYLAAFTVRVVHPKKMPRRLASHVIFAELAWTALGRQYLTDRALPAL